MESKRGGEKPKDTAAAAETTPGVAKASDTSADDVSISEEMIDIVDVGSRAVDMSAPLDQLTTLFAQLEGDESLGFVWTRLRSRGFVSLASTYQRRAALDVPRESMVELTVRAIMAHPAFTAVVPAAFTGVLRPGPGVLRPGPGVPSAPGMPDAQSGVFVPAPTRATVRRSGASINASTAANAAVEQTSQNSQMYLSVGEGTIVPVLAFECSRDVLAACRRGWRGATPADSELPAISPYALWERLSGVIPASGVELSTILNSLFGAGPSCPPDGQNFEVTYQYMRFSAQYLAGPGAVVALASGPRDDKAAAARASGPAAALAPESGAKLPEHSAVFDDQEREKLKYFAGRLRKTQDMAYDNTFPLSVVVDLQRGGASFVMLQLLTEGKDSEAVDDFLAEESSAANLRRAKREMERARSAEAVLSGQYVSIIRAKFGASAADGIILAARARNLAGRVSPSEVLRALSPRDRDLVVLELKALEDYRKAAAANRCPHKGALEKFLSSDTPKKLLNALEKFFQGQRGQQAKNALILCKNCGFTVVCPHVLVAKLNEGASYKTKMAILRPFLDVRRKKNAEVNDYHCNICQEIIAKQEQDDPALGSPSALGRYGALDEPLRRAAWGECASALEQVRFAYAVDVKRLTVEATNVVHALALAAEAAVTRKGGRQKMGTRTARDRITGEDVEMLDARSRLYVAIYASAFAASLVARHKAQFRLRTRTASRSTAAFTPVGARPAVIAAAAVAYLLDRHASLLREIGATDEFVRGRFQEASRRVLEESVGVEVVNPELETTRLLTLVTPLYWYAVHAARAVGALPAEAAATPAAARKEFETAMGCSPADIVKIARAGARDPVLAALFSGKGTIELPRGYETPESFSFLVRGPKMNMFARMFGSKSLSRAEPNIAKRSEYVAESYRSMVLYTLADNDAKVREFDKLKASLLDYEHGLLDPASAELANISFCGRATSFDFGFSGRVTVDSAYAQLQAETVTHASAAQHLSFSTLLSRGHASSPLAVVHSFGWGDAALARVFDVHGLPHVWNVFVYVTRGERSEFEGAKKVSAARISGVLDATSRLIDTKCGVCGILLSETKTAEGGGRAQEVVRALALASKIDGLFAFYEVRCPAGADGSTSHEWQDDAASRGVTCARCGIRSALLNERVTIPKLRYGEEARAYYAKYDAQFAKDTRPETRREDARRGPPNVLAMTRALAIAQDGAAAAWRYDYGVIARAATLAGVPPAVLEALGSTTGRLYRDVEEARGVPAPPESRDDPRLASADATVRAFLADYNQLRHAADSLQPPPIVAEALAAARTDFSAAAALPAVLENYAGVRRAMLAQRSATDVLNYTISSLCEAMLTISGASDLGLEFVKLEFKSILRSARLLCYPAAFNWEMLNEPKGEEAFYNEAGEADEDASEKKERDPFSMSEMDYSFGAANLE